MANLQNQLTDDALVAATKNPKWNSSSPEWRASIIDNEILRLHNTQKYLDTNISQMLANKTPEERTFITTPISQYWDKEKEIAKYNADLLALSKKYDDVIAQKDNYNNQIINLNDAKATMQNAVNSIRWSVNKSADESAKALALNKAIQIWSAQWVAWVQWATAWQLNKMQAEVANQFAPKFADVESQRQTGLGQAAQIEAGQPTALSDIASKNATNLYNASLIKTWQPTSGSSYARNTPKGTMNVFPTSTTPANLTTDAKTGNVVAQPATAAPRNLSPWEKAKWLLSTAMKWKIWLAETLIK